jgi:hypothetical protein
MTAHGASSFAQSASNIVGGFTFGTTMHGFFIIDVAFFGGMVVACSDSGQGREGGEETRDKGSTAAGNGRLGGEIVGGDTGEKQ